jgi:alkanesulfonate monooxygenase SsuD/methylene tetrahydromethanopterin reductase-like flavin-dependent oxidoreductase (luciferase family)
VETFTHKSQILAGHCRDLGRDFDAITRSSNFNVVIGRDEAEVAGRLAQIEERYQPFLSPEAVARTMDQLTSGGLVGTPEQIVEKLRTLEGLGLGYAIAYFPEVATDFTGVELFQKEVVPAFS